MFHTSYRLIAFLMFTGCCLAQQPDTVDKDYSAELPRIPALSAEESAKQFEVLDGFQVTLVAAEPLVFDPVAFAFDAKGQLWVVEMCDYSEQDKERLGRVAVLRDTNGDGVMDSRKVFVEGLSWPTALWPWQDGVIVADAPNVTFHRDLDGDLAADKSERWFVGFGRTNVQGLINSFRWGVDGWIHGVTSSSGADLETADGSKIALGRRDFAIDPMSGRLRAESGGGQHGMYFNRWGDKFVTANSDHLQQIIELESWLTSQSSSVTQPSVRKSIAEDGPQAEVFRVSPVEPWRIVRTRLRVSGVAPGMVEGGGRAAGYFTGATGTCIMDSERGFGLPGENYDTAIVCDVGSNLVHRKRLIDHGLFFSGQRIDQGTELLRSKDIWFRPVQIGEGPDGALYIADMYREVIEHPASLPPMIKKHLDLTSGRDKGRIWRLARADQPAKAIANISTDSTEQLINRLSAKVAAERTLASQLLVERFARKQFSDAEFAILSNAALQSSSPEARLLGLNLLTRFGKLDVSTASDALKEKHLRVLAQAIELSGQAGHAKSLVPQLRTIAAGTSDDRVTLAIAKVTSSLADPDRSELLSLLMPKQMDSVVRAVVATAAGMDSWKLLQNLPSNQLSDDSYSQWLVLWLPQWTDAMKEDAELSGFIAKSLTSNSPRQAAWLSALSRVSSSIQVANLLQRSKAQPIIDKVVDARLEENATVESVRWLRLASVELQSKWADRLINQATDEALQSSCIESLSWSNHPELTDRLIAQFASLTPSLQLTGLRMIVSRQDRMAKLIGALKDKKIARSQFPVEIRQSLTTQKDKAMAEQFKTLLQQASVDRVAVLEKYRPIIDQASASEASIAGSGNAPLSAVQRDRVQRGRDVFSKVCAQCHKLGELGNDVGPPLKQLSDKSPTQLLEAILDPSREVDPKYLGYTFLLDDGVILSGIIVQESGQQLVVAEAGGKQTTLDRNRIEELKNSGLSLMPNGFEEQITPAQMADLIQFLKSPNGK